VSRHRSTPVEPGVPLESAPERLTVVVPLDPYLPLRALAGYTGLSVRTLREHLADPAHPLPCYRVGGKVLVRRSEFDAWVRNFRGRAQRAQSQRVGPDLRTTAQRLADELLARIG
jgi:excisionase family DNA binding protein